MHCIDRREPHRAVQTAATDARAPGPGIDRVARAWYTTGRRLLGAVLIGLLAACATRPPAGSAPSTSPAPGARGAAPAETPLPPRSGAAALPAAPTARNWVEFKLNAGRRLVAASPDVAYISDPPEVLFGIPVIETELYVDGTIKSIRVVREPTNPAARDTVQIAIAAIRRAAPYGDMTRLSRPWKWVETFLFDDRRHFKPQSLDE